MVRHALQLVMPAHTAMLISIADSKINFFILFGFLVNKINDLLLAECAYQDTTLAVLRLCTSVDAYSAASGHVPDKWQHALEAR